jgi:hypothetical protein
MKAAPTKDRLRGEGSMSGAEFAIDTPRRRARFASVLER